MCRESRLGSWILLPGGHYERFFSATTSRASKSACAELLSSLQVEKGFPVARPICYEHKSEERAMRLPWTVSLCKGFSMGFRQEQRARQAERDCEALIAETVECLVRDWLRSDDNLRKLSHI